MPRLPLDRRHGIPPMLLAHFTVHNIGDAVVPLKPRQESSPHTDPHSNLLPVQHTKPNAPAHFQIIMPIQTIRSTNPAAKPTADCPSKRAHSTFPNINISLGPYSTPFEPNPPHTAASYLRENALTTHVTTHSQIGSLKPKTFTDCPVRYDLNHRAFLAAPTTYQAAPHEPEWRAATQF